MKDDKTLSISITSGTIFRFLFIILLFFGFYLVRDILLVVLTAVVIASAIEPGTLWLVKRHVPRVVSAILFYLTLTIAMISIFYFLIPPILNETAGLVGSVPQYIKVAELWPPIQHFLPILHIPETIPVDSLINQITNIIGVVSGGLFSTATNFLGGILNLVLIVVISFYLVAREDGVESFLRLIVPVQNEEYVLNLWKRTQIKIGLWMQGQLLLELLIGILIYLGLLILHIPHPLVLAVFAFIFELIPIFGMTLACIPAILLGLINGGVTLGLLVIALYIVVQQFESNLIYPLVVKKIIGIPPLLVILSLIIGGELAGFLGIILSVPLSVALMEYFDDVRKNKDKARGVLKA